MIEILNSQDIVCNVNGCPNSPNKYMQIEVNGIIINVYICKYHWEHINETTYTIISDPDELEKIFSCNENSSDEVV